MPRDLRLVPLCLPPFVQPPERLGPRPAPNASPAASPLQSRRGGPAAPGCVSPIMEGAVVRGTLRAHDERGRVLIPLRFTNRDGVVFVLTYAKALCGPASSRVELAADPAGWWTSCRCGRALLRLLEDVAPLGSDLHRAAVRAACACARVALPLGDAEDPADTRPRTMLETAERWCDGVATLDEVKNSQRGVWEGVMEPWLAAAAYAAQSSELPMMSSAAEFARDALSSRLPVQAAREARGRCDAEFADIVHRAVRTDAVLAAFSARRCLLRYERVEP